jgi:hypothetical protein
MRHPQHSHQQQQSTVPATFITIDTNLENRQHHGTNDEDAFHINFNSTTNSSPTTLKVVHSPASPSSSNQTLLAKVLDMSKCVAGIYASFMILSVYQERITRRPYGEEEKFFNFPLFLVFVQCLCNSLVAYVKMNYFSKERKSNVPIKFYAMAAFAYVMAFVCSNAALVYVSYPTQVLAKSCKTIPVMALGVLIAKKKYPISRYVAVLLISVGISVFMLSRFVCNLRCICVYCHSLLTPVSTI